jgi:hypothetical protein
MNTFKGLAFQPLPNFERFDKIRKKLSLQARLAEERRLLELEIATRAEYFI